MNAVKLITLYKHMYLLLDKNFHLQDFSFVVWMSDEISVN